LACFVGDIWGAQVGVRALKDIDKSKSKVHQFMRDIQRTQSTLCKIHQREIYRGKLSKQTIKKSRVRDKEEVPIRD